MDQRKLIKLGNSSYAIALPKDWVDKSGLGKGDNVFITPNSNGELIVQSNYKKTNQVKELILNLEGKKEREINREIIASYINGGTLLNINLNKKDLGFVKDVLKDLFGVEIIESKPTSIIAKEMIDMNSISIGSIIRRIDNSVRNIFELLEPCIKKGSATNKEYNEIFIADKDVNRLFFLLWRIMIIGVDNPSVLNTLNADSTSLVYSWLTGMNIEKIGDDLKKITEILSENKLKKDEIEFVEKLFNKAKENFINSLNSYHLRDKNLAFDVTKNKGEFQDLCSNVKSRDAIKEICHLFSKIHSNIHYISKYVLYFIKENYRKD